MTTVLTSDWLDRNLGNSDIFASFAMQCGLNEYAPEGRPMHEVSPLSNIPYGQSSAKLPVILSFGSFGSFESFGSFGSFIIEPFPK